MGIMYKALCCIPKHGYFAEMRLFQVASEVTAFFMGNHFYLNLTLKTNTVIKSMVFGRHFSKMNKVNLSYELDIFVANNKIVAFKWKVEFWQTCVHHCELDVLILKRLLITLEVILTNGIFFDTVL